MTALDIDFIRAQYPVFQHPEASRWAFFENAGGAYVPHQVSDRLQRFFTEYKVQPTGHSWMQRQAAAAMAAGYDSIAGMVNADPAEITLGPSTSMNLYVLAQALRPSLASGDEIIVTNQDHEANVGCWRRLEEFGMVLREWRVNPDTGELDSADLERLVNPRTRVVCFPLCSNIVGTINDAAGVCRIARSVGALTVADGVSYAPHHMPDMQTLGPDFVVFSTYKTFATHLGVLWGKAERLNALADQGHWFNADKPHYRLNPAGPLHAEIGALAGLGAYLDDVYAHHFAEPDTGTRRARTEAVYGLFAEHETALTNQFLDFARHHPRLRIVGQHYAEARQRAGTIALVPQGLTPDALAQRLAERHIAVGAGHFYALRCLEGVGLDPERGVLRVSLVHYNTADEVARLIGALDDALAG